MIIVQIREIVKLAPRDRQTMLFSATMTEDVQKLVSVSLRSPVRLAADAAGQVPDGLLQEIIRLKVRTIHDAIYCSASAGCKCNDYLRGSLNSL